MYVIVPKMNERLRGKSLSFILPQYILYIISPNAIHESMGNSSQSFQPIMEQNTGVQMVMVMTALLKDLNRKPTKNSNRTREIISEFLFYNFVYNDFKRIIDKAF